MLLSEVDAAARYLTGLVSGLGLPAHKLDGMYQSLTQQVGGVSQASV